MPHTWRITVGFQFRSPERVESLSARSTQLEEEVTQTRSTVALLTAPQVRVVTLSGQRAAAEARGRVFWDEERRVWRFYVAGLVPARTNRTYQLWFVPKAGNPVSAAVFNSTTSGSVDIEIPLPPDANDFQATAVIEEPAGGLPQPSGAFVLLGAGD